MTLAEALNALDSAADGNYWMITKGRVREGEPMYAAAVYARDSDAEDPLAISEGNDLPAVIHDVALKMGDADALRREHC